MSGFLWKMNRLRAMGLPEIVYRVRQLIQAQLESKGWGIVSLPPEPYGVCGKLWVDNLPQAFRCSHYVDAADRLLTGYFNVFSLKDVRIGFTPSWNVDPKTGTQAPLIFGKKINYRNESIVGDIKYLWEPNRHLELVTLAQAWHLTNDMKYAEGARLLVESWLQQCPYPNGPNWISSLEHAVRLVNWSFAWHLLGGQESPIFKDEAGLKFKANWLKSIYQHLHFIHGHFSRYSSANNHLLGEYMGLFIGSLTWPLWKESDKWIDIAFRGLQEEALKQNAEDGVNQEQGIWYHHEVADMMLLCGLIGKANGFEFSPAYWKRLEVMLEFIASIMDIDGNVPMIGDSDDAVMVRFSPMGNNVFRSLLATGAVLFERGDFKAKAVKFDDKSRWLLGDAAENCFNALQDNLGELPVRRAFPKGGYYLLGSDFESPEEVRILADAGPLGYLSIAAHGHADALAFTLSVGGNEILIDPGTYAYHTLKEWRDYFRGTAAHNTIRVDSLDQSVSGGNFLWVKHAKAQCLSLENLLDRDIWEAEHDGYKRLSDPVGHRRIVIYDKYNKIIQIIDRLDANKTHFVELHWHFSEKCDVEIQERCVFVRNNGVSIRMSMPDAKWSPELIRGRFEPPLGWISRGFDEKTPSPCVRWAGKINGITELSTQVEIVMPVKENV